MTSENYSAMRRNTLRVSALRLLVETPYSELKNLKRKEPDSCNLFRGIGWLEHMGCMKECDESAIFNKMKIAKKVWLNTFVALAAFILVESIYLMDIQSLATMKNNGLQRIKDVELVTVGSHLGADLYQVIADAVINRNLDKTERDWSEGKITAVNILERMSEIADTAEQKAWVVVSKQAYVRLVEIFENEAFPLLKRTTTDWVAVSMIDAKIDRQAEIIKINLSQLAASILKDEKKYNEDLDEAKGIIIQRNLFIGAASSFIILVFSFWVTRSIRVYERGGERDQSVGRGRHDGEG